MQRFWKKVDRRKPTECWPWTAALSNGRRPAIKYRRKVIPARRLAWQLAFGDIPAGCTVTSVCNGTCMNPAHLTLSRPKLTADDVRTIRTSPLPTRVLANLFNIDAGNVARVRRGEVWASVV